MPRRFDGKRTGLAHKAGHSGKENYTNRYKYTYLVGKGPLLYKQLSEGKWQAFVPYARTTVKAESFEELCRIAIEAIDNR